MALSDLDSLKVIVDITVTCNLCHRGVEPGEPHDCPHEGKVWISRCRVGDIVDVYDPWTGDTLVMRARIEHHHHTETNPYCPVYTRVVYPYRDGGMATALIPPGVLVRVVPREAL